ncbi:hypothetical protein BDV95DRAFT_602141 [Massariosphaeria phaeospora]|uniref:HMG box domain-containing protein n=1 Tax=Massariosphaeria phaeospora TaxID=100035 RepID=A0A7C8ME05_9PLEO|nr:hypothetical protein BDV95DRAFT_602141 [Massariosphaeria phaeospora]
MTDLGKRLERLGLSQYFESFKNEGFDTWETVLDITESDLNSLDVKLGHRRKLQRAIALSRGEPADRPLSISLKNGTTVDTAYRSDDSALESRETQPQASTGVASTSTKRKYRRHPKPDEHAPERPPSAYVIFSNQVREILKGQELSFTEIAKVVGERWQVLPADAREACERQANTAKEKYYADLAEYKKTSRYEVYQKYLEEFKAKHAAPLKVTEGKRSKLEAETRSAIRRNSSQEQERLPIRRVSSAYSDHYTILQQSEASSPTGPVRFPSAPSYPPKGTPPATYPSVLNSPRISDHYSPLSASPRSASLHKEAGFDTDANASTQGGHSAPLPLEYQPAYSQLSSTTLSLTNYGTRYTPVELPSRRSHREALRLPQLLHEESTISSDSGGPGPSLPSIYNVPVPQLEASKSLRVGVTPSPLDLPPLQQPPDYRNSSLAALLRAGELAREADEEAMERDKIP